MPETLRDLVVSLSLQSDNFTRNIRSVNKQIQEAESFFKLAAAGVENFEQSTAGLDARLSTLQQKLSLQREVVDQYQRALQAARDKLQECYDRQGDYANRLAEAQNRQSALNTLVAEAATAYADCRARLGESDQATLDAAAHLNELRERYAETTEEVRKLAGQCDLYETGRWSFGAIAKRLEQEGRLTSTGNNRWDESRIYTIIMNEKYVGDVLMQKKYTENHITHKEVKNRNRMVPQYYIRDHHEPIITRKQYERCQRIAVLKNNRGKPVQYPYGDMLICPVCGHRLRQHEVRGHKGMSGWHCDRDEDSCRRYIVRTKMLDRAMLEAINGLDVAKLKAEGYTELAAFRRKHWKVKTVDYYWLDEYVEKLVFGRGHTLTVHWKCGLQTTVKMRVTCNTYDPVKLAEMTMAEGS